MVDMENNEGNIPNRNNFEQNVNNTPNNGKKKTIFLVTVFLVLVITIGICAGYLFINKNKDNNVVNQTEQSKTSINNKNENKVVSVVSVEDDTEMVRRQMTIEGRDINDNTVWSYTTLAENIPQEVINRGLKLIETRKGKVYLCDWGKLYILDEQTGKVLAQNIEHNMGAAAVYIFDENDNLYTTSYLAAVDKFDTNAKLLKTTESKIWDEGFYWPKKMTLNGNNLIIDYGDEGKVTVNKDTLEIVDVNKTELNNNSGNGNQTTSYFEQNKNLNYTSNPKDNINGKVAIIKMGEKTFQTTKNNGYYTYTDNFGNSYNIKEITNITSEYRMTSNDGATNLFRAVIEYIDNNNTKKSFDTAVFVPNDANNYTTLSIYGPYENYTGTTSFVRSFTDLYDDGSKLPNGTSKIIKQLSPIGWAGSSMQEVRLYDNGDVYHIVYNGDGNTDENISSFKLIARNADTIEEKMNGQEFESIIVKGKYLTKVTDDGQLWILFENN